MHTTNDPMWRRAARRVAAILDAIVAGTIDHFVPPGGSVMFGWPTGGADGAPDSEADPDPTDPRPRVRRRRRRSRRAR
ncbi:MAG: hypothetical protein U0869_10610 [Chloroflexota bacterium]